MRVNAGSSVCAERCRHQCIGVFNRQSLACCVLDPFYTLIEKMYRLMADAIMIYLGTRDSLKIDSVAICNWPSVVCICTEFSYI